MSSPAVNFGQAADLAQVLANKFKIFVEGDTNATISTDGGNIPSIGRFLLLQGNAINTAANGILAQANDAATRSGAARDSAVSASTQSLNNLKSFSTMYLGALAADPTADAYGNAVINGASYLNTASNSYRIKGTSGWFSANIVAADLASNTDPVKGAALIGYKDNIATAVPKTVSDVLSGDEISIFRFIPVARHAGIRAGTDTGDLQSYFSAAAASGSSIYLPNGKYYVSGTTVINKSNTSWRGSGRGGTVIFSTADVDTFQLADGLTNFQLSMLSVDSNVAAPKTGNAIGVLSGAAVYQVSLRDLELTHKFCGARLGPALQSEVSNVLSRFNAAHGINIDSPTASTSGLGDYEWFIKNCQAEFNDQHGFIFSITKPSTTGTNYRFVNFRDCKANANTGYGFLMSASSGAFTGYFKVSGCVAQYNSGGGFYLNADGNNHSYEMCSAFGNGVGSTGSKGTTAPSNSAIGFYAGASLDMISFTACSATYNSGFGVLVDGHSVIATNCQAQYNMASGLVTNNPSGFTVVNGGRYSGGAGNNYGIYVSHGDQTSFTGVLFSQEAGTTAWAVAANETYLQVVGCLPANLLNRLGVAGPTVIGPRDPDSNDVHTKIAGGADIDGRQL